MPPVTSVHAFDIPPIDEMPNLCNRLGKARADRIRHYQRGRPTYSPKSRNTHNMFIHQMQDYHYADTFCPVEDIISGIARLDHNPGVKASKPLSIARLYNILQCMDTINTDEVMSMMNVDKRQAQVYVKAVKLILFHLGRHFAAVNINK